MIGLEMVAQGNVGGFKNDLSKSQIDSSFKEIIEDSVFFFSSLVPLPSDQMLYFNSDQISSYLYN